VIVDVPLSATMFVVAHFHMVMGIAPILVVFGGSTIGTRRSPAGCGTKAGAISLLVTFLGAYLIYFPMHYLGFIGVPRRYYELGETAFVPPSAGTLNVFITAAALIVGAAQMVFFFNLIWSLFKGKRAGGNPWRATTLEWQTPRPRPDMATGARSCQSSTAGLRL